MKKITLDSVKLPVTLSEFAAKCGTSIPTEIGLAVKSWLKQPVHKVDVGGYMGKACITKGPSFRRTETVYKFQNTLSSVKVKGELNLDKVEKELMDITEKNNLGKPTIEVKKAVFIINDTKYNFKYHSPAKGNVLKSINDKPIGKLSEKQVDELLKGDLKFCAPSHCTKVYKEVWECK